MECYLPDTAKQLPSKLRRKPSDSENYKPRKSNAFALDFNSETLNGSPSIKPDKIEMTRLRRKKIRCTQDFNQLSSSMTSQDSDSSTKPQLKKTKKTKCIYDLPKITNLVEDPFGNKENSSPDISSSVSMKAKDEEKKLSKKRKNVNNLKMIENAVEQNLENSSSSKRKAAKRYKYKQPNSSEVSKCQISVIYDSDEDSEIEFKIKKKMDRKHNVITNTEKSRSVKRIKNISNEFDVHEEVPENDVSEFKLEKSSRNKSKRTSSDEGANKKKYVVKHRRSKTNIAKLNEHFKNKEGKNVESDTNNCQDLISNINRKVLDSAETVHYFPDLDESNNSDDIFYSESKALTENKQSIILKQCKSELQCSAKKQIRKSVRFTSETLPEEKINIRRNTFDMDQCASSINLFISNIQKPSELKEDTEKITEINFHNTAVEEDSTFEASIQRIINTEEKNNLSQNKYSIDRSPNGSQDKNIPLNGTFNNSSSKQLQKLKEKSRSTMESLSPIHGNYSLKHVNNDLYLDTEEIFLNKEIPNSTMISSEVNSILSDLDTTKIITKKSTFDSPKHSLKNVSRQSNVDLTAETAKNIQTNKKSRQSHSAEDLHKKSIEIKRISTNTQKLNGIETPAAFKKTRDNVRAGYLKPNVNSNINNVQTPAKPKLKRSATFTKDEACEISPLKKLRKDPDIMLVQSPSVKKCLPAISPKLSKKSRLSEITGSNMYENLNVTFDGIANNNLYKNLHRKIEKSQTPNLSRLDRMSDIKSPIMVNSPNIIDSSKVTKRKQWNKSPLFLQDIPFLTSSVDIQNISVPWKENTLSDTFEKSTINESGQLRDQESRTKGCNKTSTAPPSATSTPFQENKKDLLRKALLKERDTATNESKNLNKPSKCTKKVTKTKMPNFALIHQKAYDKLESLKEMSERKALRAKLLMSGNKPDNTNAFSNSKKANVAGKSNRILDFNSAKSVSPTAPVVMNTTRNEATNLSNISITKIGHISPSKSNPKVGRNESKLTPLEKKKELPKAKSRIPTIKASNIVQAEKKGFTRFGFKVGSRDVKNTTKEEQIKAVASKTKIIKNTVEERRNIIQGVRTNRRFELLMGLRNKKM